ncbi:REP element-mobilizing transposase RayT [Pedobacter sp. CG_S7]|uniref:IS200/IS605 family transposase n=1 Tax=Pedobacter sp. CG_S7 TaxID=3143930 RepID=UPI00339A2B34
MPSGFSAEIKEKCLDEDSGNSLKAICVRISERYEIQFVEIGYESDHVHFLVEGIPSMSVKKIVSIIKSITARELFLRHPEIKKLLWGGSFWTSGYYANNTIRIYAGAGAPVTLITRPADKLILICNRLIIIHSESKKLKRL